MKFFAGMKFCAAVWLSLCLLIAGCFSPVEIAQFVDEARLDAKIGILANLDLTFPTPKSSGLERALNYFKSEKVDAVVFIGNAPTDLDSLWNKRFSEKTRKIIVDSPQILEFNAWKAHFSPRKMPFKRDKMLAFYGERRLALTDELCVLPHSSLSICAGSMSGVEIPSYYSPVAAAAKAAQGLLVRVYSGTVEIRRMDFTGVPSQKRRKGAPPPALAEEVAPAWRYKRIADDSYECLIEDAAEAPQFWDDTEIIALRSVGRNNETYYTLKFPPVQSRHTGERAYAYDVKCFDGEIRHLLSPAFFRAETQEKTAVTAKFDDPPISVTPVSSLGKRGREVPVIVR